MLSDEPIWLHDLVLEHDYRFLANLFTTLFVGKFAHMVLPPGIDGNGMLKLQFHDLTELFKAQESSARADAEGMAFVAGMQGQRSESRYVNRFANGCSRRRRRRSRRRMKTRRQRGGYLKRIWRRRERN